MNYSVAVDHLAFIFVDGAILCSGGAGAYEQGKIIPVQELGGQRGEGTYFWKNMAFTMLISIIQQDLGTCTELVPQDSLSIKGGVPPA